MLYWYSGTGNSRHIAQRLSQLLGEGDCRFVPSFFGGAKNDLITETCNSLNKLVGFCFPVYSWGVPPIILRFIREMDASQFEGRYVYAVMTCGDEAGLAAEMLRQALVKRGITLNAVFTVIMPNDYVMLPGFDIDPEQLQDEKISNAEKRIVEIVNILQNRKDSDDVFRGPMAWLKTKLVYPLFKRWGVQTSRWMVDVEKCISCGKCQYACPAANIRLAQSFNSDKKTPKWGKNCYSCTACFHICPVRAIDYGTFTRNKKQYFFPGKMKQSQ